MCDNMSEVAIPWKPGRGQMKSVRRRPRALLQHMPVLCLNYGCLLQATAMQWIVSDLGFNPVTNAAALPTPTWRTYAGYARQALRRKSVREVQTLSLRNAPYGRLVDFAEKNLRFTGEPWGKSLRRWPSKLELPDVAIVGSDQVWRPGKANVLWGVFDYLPADHPLRVAYAASFGVSEWDEEARWTTKRFGENLQRFSAVSVREASGVDLCEQQWGISAAHVLDPTMLIPAERWRALADLRPASAPSKAPRLAYMMLDDDPESEEKARELASHFDLDFYKFYPPTAESMAAYEECPAMYAMPSVEDWLRSIAMSSLVITDSFHVSVFCILFKVDFYTVRNERRGAARFRSLAGSFGLDKQFMGRDDVVYLTTLPSIDWGKTSSSLEDLRRSSIAFLRDALSKT